MPKFVRPLNSIPEDNELGILPLEEILDFEVVGQFRPESIQPDTMRYRDSFVDSVININPGNG